MNWKITLALLLSLCFSFALKAQIVLDQSDWPYDNLSLELFQFYNFGVLEDSVELGNVGPSGNYDFSRLTSFTPGDTSNMKYESIYNFPWSSTFPSAHLSRTEAEYYLAPDTLMYKTMSHFRITSGATALTGITLIVDTMYMNQGIWGGLDTFHIHYSISDTLIASDYTYGAVDRDTSFYQLFISGVVDSREYYEDSVWVDGWGTLTHPTGTFNVLRMKYKSWSKWWEQEPGTPADSGGGNSYRYEYWAKGIGHPIIQVSLDSTYSAIWFVESTNQAFVAVPEAQQQTHFENIFPNPASDVVHLELASPLIAPANIFLTDLQGKLLAVQAASPGEKDFSVDVSALPAGIYLISCIDLDGRHSGTGKIVVSR